MSSPRYVCQSCGRVRYVVPDGRGFPPDIAKRALIKSCKENNCEPEPVYYVGVSLDRGRG